MLPTFTITQGDHGYDLLMTLTDADDIPIDLTNATVRLKVQRADAPALKVNGVCAVTDALGGQVSYNIAENDFDTVGEHYAEAEITFANLSVMTVGSFVITVVPQLPRRF